MATTLIDRPTPGSTVDESKLETAARLRGRARGMRSQARALDSVLAGSYRRRASELELQAWVAELASGLPADQISAITPEPDAETAQTARSVAA